VSEDCADARAGTVMTEWSDKKIELASRYLNTPLVRSIFAHVVVTFFSLSFFKVLEARIIFDYLKPHKNDRVCDVACGCGELSTRLLKRGCQVVGTDSDKKSITIAQAFSGKNSFALANAEKLPFKRDVFDKVVSVCALEHFNEGETALQEISRILKPDGIVVLTVDSFTYPLPEHLVTTHKTRYHVAHYYSLPELKEILTELGFEVTNSKYFVNSPLAVLLFELSLRRPLMNVALFPLALILSMLSDFAAGKPDMGIFLAIRARKVRLSEIVNVAMK
jgi:ubiquinone/menaquinone biosynthesis C-methylase UbiE